LKQVDGDITCNRKAFKEFSLPTVLAIYFGSAKKFEAIVYVYQDEIFIQFTDID
jgi:hypothetical protein